MSGAQAEDWSSKGVPNSIKQAATRGRRPSRKLRSGVKPLRVVGKRGGVARSRPTCIGTRRDDPPVHARRRELIWILVVNEEDVWSEASPFLRGTAMKAAEDLLLYPLMTDDHPVCPRCLLPLALVGFQGECGKPDFSRFRCPECGRSETFSDDNDHDGAP
jgi:hypothetical protein